MNLHYWKPSLRANGWPCHVQWWGFDENPFFFGAISGIIKSIQPLKKKKSKTFWFVTHKATSHQGCITDGFKLTGRRGGGVWWCQYFYTVKQQNKQLHVIYLPSVSVCVYRRMKFKGCGRSLYNHLPWAATCGHHWWTLPASERAFMVALSVKHKLPVDACVTQQRWANPSLRRCVSPCHLSTLLYL